MRMTGLCEPDERLNLRASSVVGLEGWGRRQLHGCVQELILTIRR